MTDKTGTLTQNKMILRGLSIGDKLFGGEFNENKKKEKFFKAKKDKNFDQELENFVKENKEKMPIKQTCANFHLHKQQTKFNGNKEDILDENDVRIRSKFNFKNEEFNNSQASKKSLISMHDSIPKEELPYEELHFDLENRKLHSTKSKRQETKATFSEKKSISKKNFKNNEENNLEPSFFHTYQDLISEFLTCASLCHECIIEKKTEKNSKISVSTYQGSSPDEVAICTSMKQIGSEFLGNQLGTSTLNFFGLEKKFQVKMVKKISKNLQNFKKIENFNIFFRFSLLTVKEKNRV